jgi:hypothetical protein
MATGGNNIGLPVTDTRVLCLFGGHSARPRSVRGDANLAQICVSTDDPITLIHPLKQNLDAFPVTTDANGGWSRRWQGRRREPVTACSTHPCAIPAPNTGRAHLSEGHSRRRSSSNRRIGSKPTKAARFRPCFISPPSSLSRPRRRRRWHQRLSGEPSLRVAPLSPFRACSLRRRATPSRNQLGRAPISLR